MIVSWMTTNKCNLTCKHCYQDAGENKSAELTTSEALKLIDEIAKAGFKIMIFSGGEPMTRPDIVELVAHARERGLRPVFGTNGTLITHDLAFKLKDAGAMAMGISVDSIDPKRHNDFRGLPNAFELTLQGIENCKAAGLPFQIHTTIMDWNQNEIFDIMDWVKEIGAVNHQIFFLIPVGRGKEIEGHALRVAEYEGLLRKIMEKSRTLGIPVKPTCAPQFLRIADQLDIKTRYSRGCLAGLDYCIVSPIGKVRPCAYMMEEAGDVHDTPFDEIWANAEIFKQLRTKAYKGACGKCKFNDRCGGCRARAAYYHDGDFMQEDSYCAYGRGIIVVVVLVLVCDFFLFFSRSVSRFDGNCRSGSSRCRGVYELNVVLCTFSQSVKPAQTYAACTFHDSFDQKFRHSVEESPHRADENDFGKRFGVSGCKKKRNSSAHRV